jgi:hypothetical protein
MVNPARAISTYHHRCCEYESRSERGVQHYVIKFDNWNIVESDVKHHQANKITIEIRTHNICGDRYWLPVPDLPLCLGVLKHWPRWPHLPAKKIYTMNFCLCGAILNLKAFCFGATPDIMIAYWSVPQRRKSWQWLSGIETKVLRASGYWQKKLKMDSCLRGAKHNGKSGTGNQYLSPQMLWVRISIRARCTTLCDKVW